jgi:hypothetical protein
MMVFTLALGQMVMNVDLDAMTTDLTSLFMESALLQYSGTISYSGTDFTATLPFELSVYGFFSASAHRGPYAIDPQTLSFPSGEVAAEDGAHDTLMLVGAVTFDGQKQDVNVSLEATDFSLQGTAAFDTSSYPSSLQVTTDGAFQWQRQDTRDLLMETTVKEHLVQIYATSATVRASGVWSGKRADVETGSSK